MALNEKSLEALAAVADATSGPLTLPWPVQGNPGGFVVFSHFAEWRAFVLRLGLNDAIPQIVTAKFDRAQKLHLLAWTDFDLIKAGELVALTTLELALQDRYGAQVKALCKPKAEKKKPSPRLDSKPDTARFAELLKFMPEHDGLTDEQIPMIRRCGGTAVGFLTGKLKPTLAERRNALAHGDPFDGLPTGGLLELVRDLIEYAYRDLIAQARG